MKLRKLNLLTKHHQQGVVLVIALVLIVVIALGAIVSIRASGVDEVIGTNTRARILAVQAANAAIRECRQQVFRSADALNVLPSSGFDDNGTKWTDIVNWQNTSNINPVELPDSSGTAECMVEDIKDFMEKNATYDTEERPIAAYRITARGYSPNYREENNISVQGAQAWVQVIVGRTAK